MTEHPTDELKPCPHCNASGEGAEGGLALMESPKGWFKVLCLLCMAEGPDARTAEEGRARWNTRAFRPDPIKVAKLTSLEASGLLSSTPAEHPTDALKPCPFCAHDWPLVVTHSSDAGNEYSVRCYNGCCEISDEDRDEAVKQWNTRMEAAKPSTPIDERDEATDAALAREARSNELFEATYGAAKDDEGLVIRIADYLDECARGAIIEGDSFNLGVQRGLEIAAAQVRHGHASNVS